MLHTEVHTTQKDPVISSKTDMQKYTKIERKGKNKKRLDFESDPWKS